jgi:Tol biopolymer transport system component
LRGSIAQAFDAQIGGALALSRESRRLVYSSLLSIQDLYQLTLESAGKAEGSPERLTATTGSDIAPIYSPDGQSVAFSSSRLGHYGIWTIRLQNPIGSELSALRDSMMMSTDWSPDGKSLLYFATTQERWWQMYRIAVDSGKITQLANEAAHDIYATFSHDGNSIYFSSTRDGQLKLYKVPSSGGAATVVTARPVVKARESSDGRWLYAADLMPGNVYRMPIMGGDLTPVVEALRFPPGYVLRDTGIYYWAEASGTPELRYHDLDSGRTVVVFRPPIAAAPYLGISPDGRRLCFPLIERNSQELAVIENWR